MEDVSNNHLTLKFNDIRNICEKNDNIESLYNELLNINIEFIDHLLLNINDSTIFLHLKTTWIKLLFNKDNDKFNKKKKLTHLFVKY